MKQVLEIGSLYEIDHDKLHQNSPVQLRSIRVAMVTEKNDQRVTVRFPSLDSLKSRLSDLGDTGSHGRTRSCNRASLNPYKLLTLLDEKYEMRAQIARAVLHRKISSEEWSKRLKSWTFWSTTAEIEEQSNNRGPCLVDFLNRGEMLKWGVRTKIQFIGRHRSPKNDNRSSNARVDHQINTDVVDDESEDDEIHEDDAKSKNSDDDDDEEEEVREDEDVNPKNSGNEDEEDSESGDGGDEDDEVEVQIKRRKRKRKHVKTETKRKRCTDRKPRKIMPTINRWSEERFKQSEESMLKVMKAKGAVAGNPIMRLTLRNEARKLIGDTGLLDHLLKHLAGRVAPGGRERFRRRHNPEGAMEYWLESADLLKIRKDAGVQDPYWIPPPGWKPGDSPTQDPVLATKLKELKEKMIQIERDMEEMKCRRKDDNNQLAMVTTPPSSCVVNQIEHDHTSPWIPTKEMLMELVKKNEELGDQVMQISRSLKGMEREIQKLKYPTTTRATATLAAAEKQAAAAQEEEITQKSTTSSPPPNPTLSLVAYTGTENEEDEEKALAAAIRASEKAAMVQRLKSGFRICRPQGTFLWPSDISATTSSSSPSFGLSSPTVPTPSSCHSSTTTNMILPPPPPPPTGISSWGRMLDLNSVPITENFTTLSAYSSPSMDSSISE